jgi:pimeloyl-ACP methyl ester carboxylesterase
MLTWGKHGKPGLLFLHGGGAHADWWSYIAPFFADRYRIVAPTFTGMGRSDRRAVYRFQQFVREAREAARAGGAFAGGPPVVVGHSFGGRVAMGLAREFGPELAAAILVDPPHFAPENARPPSPPRPSKKRLPHTSLESLVERFYLAPPQLCENLYVLDFLARRSAREVVDGHGRRGWELSFDRGFWDRFERVDTAPLLAGARCPVALIRGAESKLITAVDAAHLMSLIAKDSPHVVIPDARHHVTVDQPLAFVAALSALLEGWPPARRKALLPQAGEGGREAAG